MNSRYVDSLLSGSESLVILTVVVCVYRRYFQHAHFISIVGVGKRGAY